MSKLELWNKIKQPPTTALKAIGGGRLKGKTDINPQWRMQAMTEQFGQCGTGWKYTIDKLWTEKGSGDEVMCFALVSLYTFSPGVGSGWSQPIPGIGGSMLVTKESSGLHSSDEGYKMAVTDALSVAMKSLGMAADIYLGNFDGSKYKAPVDLGPKAGVWDNISSEDTVWIKEVAAETTSDYEAMNIAGCLERFEMAGFSLDQENAFWDLLDSKVRSTIKAAWAINKAETLEGLKAAWDAAPKHALKALESIKETKKFTLQLGD